MTELELEKLQKIKVPEARLSSRQQTLQSAISEFDTAQTEKNSFSLSNLILGWLPSLDNLWGMFNPRIAGALSAILLVCLGTIIYLPDLTRQHEPQSISNKEETPREKSKQHVEESDSVTAQKPTTRPPSVQNVKPLSPPTGISGFNRNTPHTQKKSLESRKRSYRHFNAPSGNMNEKPVLKKNQGINRGIGKVVGSGQSPEFKPIENKSDATKIFTGPQYQGKALHHCLEETLKCGQIVADRFCRVNKFEKAKAFQIDTSTAGETISIENGTIFKMTKNSKPVTFLSITCSRNPKK